MAISSARKTVTDTANDGTPTTITEILYWTTTGTNGAPRDISTSILSGGGGANVGNPNNLSPPNDQPSSATEPASAPSVSGPSSEVRASTLSSNAQSSTASPGLSSGQGSGSGTTETTDSNSGFSGGDLAGAAIGCLIGGAIIAFLVAFLIFRKREQRKSRAASYYQSNDSRTQRDVVALSEKPSSKSASTVMGWQGFLPQSADDRTIQNGVKTFFNLIDLHVDNYYRKAPLELDQRTREALAQIDSGKLPGRIDKLMQDDRVVLPVIKHCIADLLITRMSPLTYPETSLLPSHLSAIPTKLQTSSLSSSERSGKSYPTHQRRPHHLLTVHLHSCLSSLQSMATTQRLPLSTSRTRLSLYR